MSKVPRDTVRQAIRLLRLEKSPQEIVAHFKGRFEWSEFEIGIAEEKERRRGYNQHRRYLSKTMQLGLGLGPEPSPSALADRECRARLRDHVSFSIRHFGDPLPGYSALDARSKQPRSRMSDPLAGLKYGRDRIVELDLPQ